MLDNSLDLLKKILLAGGDFLVIGRNFMKKVEKTMDCLGNMLKVRQKRSKLLGKKEKTNDHCFCRNLTGKSTLGEEGIFSENGRSFKKTIDYQGKK